MLLVIQPQQVAQTVTITTELVTWILLASTLLMLILLSLMGYIAYRLAPLLGIGNVFCACLP